MSSSQDGGRTGTRKRCTWLGPVYMEVGDPRKVR